GDPDPAAAPRRRYSHERERPLAPVHRLQVRRGLGCRYIDFEDQLVGLERGRAAVVGGRQAVEVGSRELALGRAERRPEPDGRRSGVGRMRRGAALVPEDRMLTMRAVLCEATLAAVQPAVEAE